MAETESLSPEARQAAQEELRDKLIAEQSLTGAIVGGFAAALPGFFLYLTMLNGGWHPIILFFVPGVFVGFGVRWFGRGILPVYGRIAAFVVVIGLALVWAFYGLAEIAIGLAIPNVFIAMLLAPRSLTRKEGGAVYDYRMGRWHP